MILVLALIMRVNRSYTTECGGMLAARQSLSLVDKVLVQSAPKAF